MPRRPGSPMSSIVNTCAVTAEAERQARQAIRKAKRERPQARIVVTGCAAQTNPERFAAMAEVDRVIGNDDKIAREAWIAAREASRAANDFGDQQRAEDRRQRHHVGEGDRGPPDRGARRAHPRLCPGPERLRPSLHLLHHPVRSRQFAFGADGRSGRRRCAASPTTATARWCSPASISRATAPICRARRSSARWCGRSCVMSARSSGCACPRSIASRSTTSCLAAFAEEPRLMPHLHLSLQSGDDLILKRMKRRHSRAAAVALAETAAPSAPRHRVRRRHHRRLSRPKTEAMFSGSLALVGDCGLTHLHVFPYSPRPGTPAARMPQVAARRSPRTAPGACAKPATRRSPAISTARSAGAAACSPRPPTPAAPSISRRCGSRGRSSRASSSRPR